MNAVFEEDPSIKSFLQFQETVCKFNTTFSSHMEGVWEHLIGVIRRKIDSIYLDFMHIKITHKVLVTFMTEATVIVNAFHWCQCPSTPKQPLRFVSINFSYSKCRRIKRGLKHRNISEVYTFNRNLFSLQRGNFSTVGKMNTYILYQCAGKLFSLTSLSVISYNVYCVLTIYKNNPINDFFVNREYLIEGYFHIIRGMCSR